MAVKEYLAFIPIERSLGQLAHESMHGHAEDVSGAIKAALLKRDYSAAYEVLPHIDFQHAEYAIRRKGPLYFKAAYLLGASFARRGLRNLPKDAIERLPPQVLNNVSQAHADIVSTRLEIVMRQALVKIIRSAQYDYHEGMFRKKADEDELVDQLNKAVDGNTKMMASASANLSTSRLAAYGFLNEADVMGITQYQLQAVMDDRTTVICQDLDGRTFDVSISLNFLDSILQATDPESLRSLAPFIDNGAVDASDIPDMSDDELQSQGVMVPPFHFGCRTILVQVGDVQVDESTLPDGLDDLEGDIADIGVDASTLDDLFSPSTDDEITADTLHLEADLGDDNSSQQGGSSEDEAITTPSDAAFMSDAPAVIGGDETTLEYADGTVMVDGVLEIQGDDAVVQDGEFKGWRKKQETTERSRNAAYHTDDKDDPDSREAWKALLAANHDLQMLLFRPMPVVRKYHIPYVAGAQKAAENVYIDPCVPYYLHLVTGICEPVKYLVRHEIVEWWLMTTLGWPYFKAHNMALAAEHALMIDDGFEQKDIDVYEDEMQKLVHLDEDEAVSDLPDDLYRGPYESGEQSPLDKKVLAVLDGQRVTVQKGGVGSGIKGHVTIRDNPRKGKFVTQISWLKETPQYHVGVDAAGKTRWYAKSKYFMVRVPNELQPGAFDLVVHKLLPAPAVPVQAAQLQVAPADELAAQKPVGQQPDDQKVPQDWSELDKALEALPADISTLGLHANGPGAKGVNDSNSFEYNGKKFFAKKSTNYGNANAEVVAGQVGRVLGLNVFPVVPRGDYMVTPWLTKPNMAQSGMGQVALDIVKKMSDADRTREIVGQAMLGDPDRHRGNFLVDKEAGKIYDIDWGGAFKDMSGWVLGSNAFVGMARNQGDGDLMLDRSVLQDLLSKKEQVQTLLSKTPQFSMTKPFDIVAKLAKMDKPTYAEFRSLMR